MKEDYLWDKTGEDAEIEKLENMLQVFRAKTEAEFSLASNIVPATEKPTRRRFFSFSLAFAFTAAAALALILILPGVWFQVSIENLLVGDDLTKTITPKIDVEISEPATVEKPDGIINIKLPVRQRPVRSQNPKSQIPNPKSNKSKIQLTEEEKYAYNQLMLAFSITSSKLKLVRDKVEGVETQKVIVKPEDKTRRN